MKVLVLGAGKMATAVLTGFKKTENLHEWMIYSPSGVSAQNLAAKVGARFVSDLNSVKNPDWILVGCKPQQLPDLKQLIGDKFKGSLFVSLLAAVSEEDQLKMLGEKNLIRVMPNLPVAFNEGVTLIASRSAESRLSSFNGLFAKLGLCLSLKEEELDELTLLTGSGPAFFYEFAKNLAESFTSLNDVEREKLVRQVMIGSSKSLGDSSSLVEKTAAVTSKGGVTIAVLEKWRELDLKKLLLQGINRGKERSTEIKAHLRS